MIDFNTKDIIKVLPLDVQFRDTLLKEYDAYDESRRFEVSSVCWSLFSEMTDKLTEIKYREMMEEVETGARVLTGDMMNAAREAVHQDYKDILSGKKEEVEQMESIRAKLQEFMKQINK